MSAKHTETPWFVSRSSLGVHHYVEARIRPGVVQEIASCGPTEGDEGSEGNAEFIVRACNAHDDFIVFASLITRLNADEGLSPAALSYVVEQANKVLKKAGVA